MRNFDENTITKAVLAKVGGGKDLRIQQVSEALIRHLHAFIREIEPTQDEWMAGIDFLTRVGGMCSATRQEFILLSDTLGVSMLVDAINHRHSAGTTQTTVLGPFYVPDAPEFPLGACISGNLAGEKMVVEGLVCLPDGSPIGGAIVDVWHSDADGYYDVQRSGQPEDIMGRARLRTDAEGRYWFTTIIPSFYPIPHDGPVGEMLAAQGRHPFRPAHVHFMIAAEGCETLVTHLFLADDPYLDSDVVFGVKDALVVRLESQLAGHTVHGNRIEEPIQALRYDFVLAEKKTAKTPPFGPA